MDEQEAIKRFWKSMVARCLVGIVLLAFAGCGGADKKESSSAHPESGQAKVGVGKKGDGYGNHVPILKPASVFFKAKEKIAFEIVIPKNLQLFEATYGRKPKSHDEFMQKIIKEGKVKLPELKDGLEYYYDPMQGELMVRSMQERSGNR